ncbi:MAG: SIMPL domain-containing protein [Muribaculaceae bacterium]|nr:SIMPL domain-containing protein [Muribaculaceae bacterium]
MTKTSTTILAAVIIGAALASIGLALRSGINNLAFRDRAVTVRGLATREVQADKVTWPIAFTTLGNDLPTLYDQVTNTNKVITEFLTSNGIDASEISVGQTTVFDRDAERYSSGNLPYRFTLTSVLVLSSNKVSVVKELIKRQGELIKKGISIDTGYQYQTIYEFTGLNDIKPEMVAEATNAARESAVKFAEDSGSKLGKIKTASQGQFSIEDRDQYTPYIKTVRVVNSITYYLEH